MIYMSRRSRTQRLVILLASVGLIAGGVPASATALAATGPLHVTALVASPAVDWVETTDPPSGITAELPGKASVRKQNVSIEGKNVDARMYSVDTPDGTVGFTVHDMPGDQYSLEDLLKGFAESYMQATAEPMDTSNVRKVVFEGRPAIEADLASVADGERLAGFILITADDARLVQALALGPEANEKALKATYERFLDSLRLP
ncbi:hypothetical protein [Streptomyces sp. A0592]|uniref:hypothetical protein n=1 Tax=Streptomyces sp. A0592 TaxID=2563099 RepID=UPI00109EC8D1|nr:hypothetical protein [Streptomyces sp. A0592]THA78703.1 hypothetical protein E6U81_33355 [Streptomyces sp. A0592]